MKEILTAVSIICVSAVVCSIMSNFITDSNTKKILTLVLGGFMVCSIILPIKNAISKFELNLEAYPSYESVVATDDEAFSKNIIYQTKLNLDTTLCEILRQNDIEINSCDIVLAENKDNGIIISGISIYLNKKYINNIDYVSEIVEKNFSIIPDIITE